MNMKRLFLCLICILLFGVHPADALTLSFNEVDSGTHTPIDLANQFSAFGVSFTDVYRYYNTTDNYFGGDSYGIANGTVSQIGDSQGTTGTVVFSTPTPSITFDWWTSYDPITITAYAIIGFGNDVVVGSYSSIIPYTYYGEQNVEIIGSQPINYFTFHDGGGIVNISSLTYGYSAVPEPSSLVIFSIILVGTGIYTRRKFRI